MKWISHLTIDAIAAQAIGRLGGRVLSLWLATVAIASCCVPAQAQFYNLSKDGAIFGTTDPAYYPCLVDMTGDANWPHDWALYTSTDHGAGGIYLYVATGDPTVAGNWKDYDTALADGDFDAYGTKPASNPIYIDTTEGAGDSETPCVVLVGSTYHLTYHNSGFAGDQKTLLATSSDGLNFTRYTAHTGGSSAVILDPDSGIADAAHTGYFRWSANPFSGVAYTYVGYSLLRGGDRPVSAQWGSDDAINWTLLGALDLERFNIGLPSGREIVWHSADPGSVLDLGDGEYAMMMDVSTPASGAVAREISTYEFVLDATGRDIQRQGREVLAQGGASAIDEDEAGSVMLVDYSGTPVVIYTATDSANANRLAMASGSTNSAAAYPDAKSPSEEYDTEFTQDFRGDTAFDAWVELIGDASPSAAWSASGVTIDGGVAGDWAQLSTVANYDLSGYEMVEIFATGYDDAANSANLATVGSGRVGDVDDGVEGVAYLGVSHDVQILTRVGSATADSSDSDYLVNDKRYDWGIRLYPQTRLVQILGHERGAVREYTHTEAVDWSTLTSHLQIGSNSGAGLLIETLTVRLREPAPPVRSSFFHRGRDYRQYRDRGGS